jgi:multidrug resistance efflux pump
MEALSAAIALGVVASLVAIAALIAVRKLKDLGSLRATGPLGTSVEVTANHAESDAPTVLALARQLGDLDGRVRNLETQSVIDRATISRLESELAEARWKLEVALNDRSQLAGRVLELEAHVSRLEAELAEARNQP